MKVVAFSCAHFATPDTQMELQDHLYDYRNVEKMMERINTLAPERVISLGDLWEPLYDSYDDVANLVSPIVELPVTLLNGNHDRGPAVSIEIDGIEYEHGHKRGPKTARSKQDYIQKLRQAVAGKRIVHGHTHQPSDGWAFDVGSITFSGTFGLIEDGVPKLESVT